MAHTMCIRAARDGNWSLDAQGRMVRCLGRLKRGPDGWCITMVNIRATH